MPNENTPAPRGRGWRSGERLAGALPAAIRLWLLDHPGEHRARDVAEALPLPADMTKAQWSQKVANALSRLARNGEVIREDRDLGYKRPVGHYRLAVPADHTTGSVTR